MAKASRKASSKKVSSKGKKFVYMFGGAKSEGNESMKNLLGGKGANLGHMYSRFPIPDGFCITIGAFEKFLSENKFFQNSTHLS